MITFYDFGVADVLFGALVSSTTTEAGNADATFDAESYDLTGWHSTSSNTERLTVPASVSLVRMSTMIAVNNLGTSYFRKNGSLFFGTTRSYSNTAGDEYNSATSAIVAASPGDYFTLFISSGLTALADYWMGIEVIDPSTKYALVSKTGNQAISAGTTTTLTWDSESADTDGFHDNVTNNSRLTVPSGVTKVRLSGGCRNSQTTSGQTVVSITKNGASARGLPIRDEDNLSADNSLGVVSSIQEVTAGDYFEMRLFVTNAANAVAGDETWFQIEEIPSDVKYAVVYKSTTQSITGGAAPVACAFGAELYDADGMHDNTTNNSRLTVPSGCSWARASFGLTNPSTANELIGEVRKNGSVTIGCPRDDVDTAGTDNINGMGAWVAVTPGDYFELFVSATTTQTLADTNSTWFCLECK